MYRLGPGRVVAFGGREKIYEIEAEARDLGWRLRVEVHRAVAYAGELRLADPDGIVVDACFSAPDACRDRLSDAHPWVREPLHAWIDQRWTTDDIGASP